MYAILKAQYDKISQNLFDFNNYLHAYIKTYKHMKIYKLRSLLFLDLVTLFYNDT